MVPCNSRCDWDLCKSVPIKSQVIVWNGNRTLVELQTCRIENLEWKIDPVRIGEESSSHIGGMLVNFPIM